MREIYSNAQVKKNDLAKIDKVKLILNEIKHCEITVNDYLGEYDNYKLSFVGSNGLKLSLGNKNVKFIKYGGRLASEKEILYRIINLFDSLDKTFPIKFADPILKKEYKNTLKSIKASLEVL
jgi:hypothetical protein